MRVFYDTSGGTPSGVPLFVEEVAALAVGGYGVAEDRELVDIPSGEDTLGYQVGCETPPDCRSGPAETIRGLDVRGVVRLRLEAVDAVLAVALEDTELGWLAAGASFTHDTRR